MRRSLAPLAVLLALAGADVGAQPAPGLYDLKALYLYNFLRYVEWPTRPATGPLIVCVVGLEHVGAILEKTIGNDTVGGRPIQSRVIQEPDPDCHIVFAPKGVNSGIYARAAHGQLTVGESPAFLQQGGVIAFTETGGKLRFEINTEAAMRADVRISSRLLRLGVASSAGERP